MDSISNDIDTERVDSFLQPDGSSAALNLPKSNSSLSSRLSNSNWKRVNHFGSNAVTSRYQSHPPGVYFRSRRVKKGEVERPWLNKPDPREKWANIFPMVGAVLGLIIGGIFIWDGIRSVGTHKYCEVLNDNFSSWDSGIWTKEVEVGGYGSVKVRSVTTCPC